MEIVLFNKKMIMSNKKTVGRPSQRDKEVLLISVKRTNGKTVNKTFRAESFNFEQIIEKVGEVVEKKDTAIGKTVVVERELFGRN